MRYADGRVIHAFADPTFAILERRLTPEGVDLVRSGTPQPKTSLVPCTTSRRGVSRPRGPTVRALEVRDLLRDEETNVADPSGAVSLLPPRAEALLRGTGRTHEHTAGLNDPASPGVQSGVMNDPLVCELFAETWPSPVPS
jgi:hypothetical protein